MRRMVQADCGRQRTPATSLYLAGAHELEEGFGVVVPVAFFLFVGIQHLLLGGEERLVFIGAAADFAKEVGEVGLFGESG